jgi:hypothetical protein
MNAPVPALDWPMSAYDAPSPPRVFCPACLVLYGTHIPDDQRWQMGG